MSNAEVAEKSGRSQNWEGEAGIFDRMNLLSARAMLVEGHTDAVRGMLVVLSDNA
jgi:hypothetical protein